MSFTSHLYHLAWKKERTSFVLSFGRESWSQMLLRKSQKIKQISLSTRDRRINGRVIKWVSPLLACLLVTLNVMINPKIGKYWIEAMDLIDSSSQAVRNLPRAFRRKPGTVLPSEVYATLIYILVVNSAPFPFTIVLNLPVMVDVKTKPQLRTKYNVMIPCWAVTDFLVVAITQPLVICLSLRFHFGFSSNA